MKPIIVSNSAQAFANRREAGRQLGLEVKKRISEKPLVLGIPRGGMVTAAAVASVLESDLDIILTHKIRAPYNPELAIGAVSEEGQVFLNGPFVRRTKADQSYIEAEKRIQLKELVRRRELFRGVYPKISLKDRVVVITDDGIATGSTVQAALWSARRENPKYLIGAFPVAPPDTLERLQEDADEIICLQAPYFFNSVSQFYVDFPQVPDEKVMALLKQEKAKKKARGEQCAQR